MNKNEAPPASYDIDPVCGMKVDKARNDKMSFDYKGEHYRFCNPKCHEKFAADPYFYLSGNNKKIAPPADVDTSWTCPMDPEIVTEEPGTCPICGMALEPMDGVSDEPNHELIDFKKRLGISVLAAIPILILSMGPMIGINLRSAIGETPSLLIEFILASLVVLWAARPFFERGWTSLKTRHYNMWTLIMLGVGAAYIYSTVALLFPGIFPKELLQNGHPPVYFEASVVIVALVFVGQVMELTAREKTGDAIRSLLDLSPKTARRITPDGDEYDAPLANIIAGDHLRVLPGSAVPVDGQILEGQSSLDESMITGEAMPVFKAEGDLVTGGTMNKSGSFIMEAKAVGTDTMLSRIVKLVAEAQRSRTPIQALADRVAGWFVPLVVGISLLAFVVWLIWGPSPSLLYALVSAVSVLIIACPCALGLATPMSIMTATGRGAKAGVLVRSAESLEQMAKLNTLIVDKTGTLTEGRPKVTAIIPASGISEEKLVSLAASLEASSEHPLAEAITQAAKEKSIKTRKVSQFEALPGQGVQGQIGNAKISIGNAKLMQKIKANSSPLHTQLENLQKSGHTVISIAQDQNLIGLIAITDPIKKDAKSTIQSLKKSGLEVIMATGDNAQSAQLVADQLGLDGVYAEVLPEEKQNIITQFQEQGKLVGMAGDGVNDAPALAQADIGIAMGTGADIAIESADIMLVKGNLKGLLRARRLSTLTIKNIKQNLFFAFFYNSLGVPIAAGVLYPLTGQLLSPIVAALAMSFSSVSVILNALRLRNAKLDEPS